jgi:hypothetical protein
MKSADHFFPKILDYTRPGERRHPPNSAVHFVPKQPATESDFRLLRQTET